MHKYAILGFIYIYIALEISNQLRKKYGLGLSTLPHFRGSCLEAVFVIALNIKGGSFGA